MEAYNNETANLKCIKSAKLAKILINEGFVVRDIKPNQNNPSATVFLFEKTEALMRIVDEFLTKENEDKIMRDWKGGKSF